jgi:DNA-binding XRE family transcriptional regulator
MPENAPRIQLKAARVNKDLSQAEAAKELDISKSSLQKYETYQVVPPWDVVTRMSSLYDIHTDYLIFLRPDSAKSVIKAAGHGD